MAQTKTAATSELTTADQYLTFQLADEEYGLEILKVREIIGMMDITSVPRTPEFVLGVINLRGNVIPVIDLRLKFAMEATDYTEETCVIVVDVEGLQMGIVVDRVSDVLDIGGEDIQDAPSFGVAVDTDFILGIGKTEDRVTILLDINRVLTDAETSTLKHASKPSTGGDSTDDDQQNPQKEEIASGEEEQKQQ